MVRRNKPIVVAPVELESVPSSELQGRDFLTLRYVLVDQVLLLQGNPKLHDDPAIEASIVENGFRDPPSWDVTLNDGAGGVVEGSGRTTVLKLMQDQGRDVPRGIGVHRGTGQWAMPIIFGCDARSEEAALRYAVDHNNLVLGSGFTATETVKIWDESGYIELLERLERADNLPVTVPQTELESILQAAQDASNADPESGFDPIDPEDLPSFDGGDGDGAPGGYLKFGSHRVPLTSDELFRLSDALDRYVEQFESKEGFVEAMLNGDLQ